MNIKIFDSTFIIGAIAAFIIQTPLSIATSYVAIFAFVATNSKNINIKKQHFAAGAIIFAGLAPASLTFNHGLTPILYLASTSFSLVAAFELSKRPIDKSLSSIRTVFWLLALFVVIGYILNIDDPEPLGAILPWASTNGLPSYVITIQILYSIVFFLKNDRLPIASTSITLLISIMGIGRGSIIISSLLLAFSIITNTFDPSISLKRKITIGAGAIAAIITVAMTNTTEITDAINETSQYSKLSGGLLDEHRGLIIYDYLNKLDPITLLIGMNYDGTSIVKYYGGNPHNSFIRAHSFYGIFGLLCIFIPLAIVAILPRKTKQRTTTLILISFALIRSSTEPIFFPTPLDLFYFMYATAYVQYSQKIGELKNDKKDHQ